VAEVLVNDNQPVKAGQPLVKLARGIIRRLWIRRRRTDGWRKSEAQSGDGHSQNARERGRANVERGRAIEWIASGFDASGSGYDQAKTSAWRSRKQIIDKSRANAQLAQADLARFRPLMEKGEIRSSN